MIKVGTIVAFKLYGETEAHVVTGSTPWLHSNDKVFEPKSIL